jgi:glycosyltransferase involved in cell wall biosynthesis
MRLPKVSVIIPTFNYANFLDEAVRSVINQTYPAKLIEIIVVDDGSTDNTSEVLKKYTENGSLQYYFQANAGKASATYNAIQKCTGDYIFNLDADDYFFPDKVAAYVNVFNNDESIVHVGSPANFYYQDTQLFKAEVIPADILAKALDGKALLLRLYNENILFGGGSSFAARASVLKSINIAPGVDMFIDEFLLIAVLPLGKSYFIDRPLSIWRVHSSNFSSRHYSKEKVTINQKRLLTSSAFVLDYVEKNNYDDRLVKIYKLIDASRMITFKESYGRKTVADTWSYAYHVFFNIKPGFKMIVKYNVFGRLMPPAMMQYIRKIKRVFVAPAFVS